MRCLAAIAFRLLLAACLVAGPLNGARTAIAADLAPPQAAPCADMQGMGAAAADDEGGARRPCCPAMPDCPAAHCAPSACAPSALAWIPVVPMAWHPAFPLAVSSSPPRIAIAAADSEPPIRPPIA